MSVPDLDAVLGRVEAALPNTGTTHVAHVSEWCVYEKDAQHGATQGAITDADIRALVSALREARADTKRLDWIERRAVNRAYVVFCSNGGGNEHDPKWASVQVVDSWQNPHAPSELREASDIRAALDAAIHGEDRG